LSTTAQAVEFVRSVGRENVKIQHDFYHMQRMEGNLVANLRQHVGLVGHVQIADSPGRGEPGTGEIHYPYVLSQLEELGYSGYVGLEYNPTMGTTEESLVWLPKELRDKDASVEDLKLY
jgi:hydroxypyruvate isomerase